MTELATGEQPAVHCQLCDTNEKHPLFCYLISDVGSPGAQYLTYIGVSSQPWFRVRAHNREPFFRHVQQAPREYRLRCARSKHSSETELD